MLESVRAHIVWHRYICLKLVFVLLWVVEFLDIEKCILTESSVSKCFRWFLGLLVFEFLHGFFLVYLL